MKIGSNNSLTYLKPLCSWWLKIFRFFGKRQDIDYKDQYILYGIRVFDFRLYIDKHDRIGVKNGSYKYPLFSFYEILNFLNRKGDATVIISLDVSKYEYLMNVNMGRIVEKFIEKCRIISTIYEHIAFCGGYRQFDKKVIYNFRNKVSDIICAEDLSRKYKLISIFCPNLLRKMNKKYIEQYKDSNDIILLNYINKT